jgi:hypothetical protein
MDVEGHIKPGDKFVEVISHQIAASDVVLVVIGPRWTSNRPLVGMIQTILL